MTIDTSKIEKQVRIFHDSDSTGHDTAHIFRVLDTAKKIAFHYPCCDIDLVICAALLHDIADHKLIKEDEKTSVLEKMRHWIKNAGADDSFAEKVLFICQNISFSSRKTNAPLPLEGQIVQDADRIDAIGAIGIARAFAYGGAKGRCIYSKGSTDDTVSHFYDKLLKIKDLINTPEGKELAQNRHDFMLSFLDELYRECDV
ncbi:MAG: HD domain-containing protein [Flavobacteriales bacterium]|nr:HD domain-containing protein [Flavobacteriales bacterium]